ncbi:MAG TPA: lamin tail domain-containing protein, partial [Crocinitomicaceae bacterium]|nr:lamin tail domain-containing protein [Crocinitomicaceae bacterium]
INNWSASVAILGGTPNAVNSVFDNSPDVVAPKIDTIFVLNATTLSVKISETLLSSSISQIVATLTPTLAVSSISQDSTDLSLLTVQLGAPLEINKTYSLKLEALQDCESNSGQSEKNFILKVSETPTAGDIIINEVMFDPSPVVGLPEYEFVEIYNRSNKYFNLKGWKLGNNSTFGTINSSVWIAPNEYKVLTSSGGVSSFSDAVSVTSFPTLKNNADDVIILDSLGSQIDKITYNLAWYKDDEKKDGGYTLERINTNLICSDINNWSASVAILGGTPNAVNSVFDNSPDVVAPKLFAVDVLSDTTLKVIFTEAVLSSNFVFLINPTLTISQITDDTANLAVVYLTLTNKIAPSTSYTLTAQNIEDCEGNLTVEDHVNFVLAHLPQKGEIVFNELLFNPLTGGSDFIELKNITDKTFNLKGLQLTNTKTGTSNNKMLTDNYYLYPQGIVVLTPDTLFLKQNYPFVGSSKFIQTAIPTLNNDVSTIKLFLDSLTTIDSLTYSEKWHFQLLDDYKGKSLERISDNAVSTDASSWHTAAEYTGFATPALENSQNTEYLYNGTLNLSSETLSPDNDGFEDFLTMTYEMDNSGYVGSITIFDDRGREVRKLIQNELLGVRGEFLWDGLNEKLQKANIGTHIIIFSGYHATTGKTFKIKKVVVVASQKH